MTKKNLAFGGGAVAAVFVIGYGTVFFLPRTVSFSYAGDSCITNPVILPGYFSTAKGAAYNATARTSVSIGNLPLYSHTTCVEPAVAPKQNTTELISFGSSLFKKKIHIKTNDYPKLANQEILDLPVPTQDKLNLALDEADAIFEYRLRASKKQIDCEKASELVSCDVAKLKLAQSKKYDFTFERLFKGQPTDKVFEEKLRTVKNVRIVKSSIQGGQTIYTKPKQMLLTLNRAAESVESVELKTGGKTIGTDAELNGKKLAIKFKKDLPRDVSFELKVSGVRAADGGFLSKPYVQGFRTSGGPKVTAVNVGTYKSSSAGPFVISFDSTLLSSANAQKFVQLEVGGKVFGASVSAQGNTAVISPSTTLPRCTAFTLRVVDGLQNNHNVAGGSGWTYNSRTLCQSVFSIGTSVQGRSITAYSFGTGGSEIVYVGTTHGDETSSTSLMYQWIEELEAQGHNPSNSKVIVIPNLNPDGYAAGTRNNARNVDLNRNFPANNWQSSTTTPYGATLPNGGGSKPLSEPESAAIANYLLSIGPRLVLTYHSKAGVVIPNGAGDSNTLAGIYGQKSNVYHSSGAGVFEYNTTGEMETWLHDKVGIPCLLIELWTKTGYEFTSHRDALWAMANL